VTDRTCPQSALVEALHDRRLGAPEQASLERHISTCAECRALQRRLAAVREAVCAPVEPVGELAHQRARLALLRAAAEPPVPAHVRYRRWVLAAGLIALATSAAAGVAIWRMRAPDPTPPTQEAPISPPSEAPISPPSEAPRPPVPESIPTAPAPPIVVAPDPPTPPVEAKPPRKPPRRPPPLEPPASAPAPTPSPASRDFAAAMAALEGRDFILAARRFEAFVQSWPADPRSDEAAYLIAIALQRGDLHAEARAAAQRYLQERPHGAHRARASKIAAH
jgi:type IV secretory pathway VirB10-like protein